MAVLDNVKLEPPSQCSTQFSLPRPMLRRGAYCDPGTATTRFGRALNCPLRNLFFFQIDGSSLARRNLLDYTSKQFQISACSVTTFALLRISPGVVERIADSFCFSAFFLFLFLFFVFFLLWFSLTIRLRYYSQFCPVDPFFFFRCLICSALFGRKRA